MRLFRYLPFLLLMVYSLALLRLDITGPQEDFRGYFSDIVVGATYSLPYSAFFGINTSITAALLIGISILFLVCIGSSRFQERTRRELFFVWSQVVFFLYFALDERLQIHEYSGRFLGVNDAFLLFGLAIAELILLLYAGDLINQRADLKAPILAAGTLFGVMVVIDAFGPEKLPGRLATEDLSKTWAVAFLFLYAWRFCMQWLSEIGREVGRPSILD